jgi:hypothetical protein
MNETDAINELRDRLGRAEDRLSRGDSQFQELLGALTNVTAHLKRQDDGVRELGEKIDAQGARTAAIVDMWDGGVNATRFFCRLARAWEWLVKQIFSKRSVGLIVGYIVLHWILFQSLPAWTKWAIAAYKLYQGG